ncbi:amino acid adenylation domain-containing protein [Mucilaginibacter frigoritolerans]|uniref:Amino acid adenylation domain-containing protein n=1 Tax=Mucilaginibacter frigoritolerans TaxID=652788 RepID=A0A562TT34_9SPHI|nr:non-ribosomal peptide synthetase [Mucilaginibacter frigoritolerans]TWI96354.1 amino acid adenylation domain-containing protein [Mucilaginibacter frigoritolerans]
MKINPDSNSLIFDTHPVDFDPFAETEQIHPASVYSVKSSNKLVSYTTFPVEFDPFTGPEISSIAPVTESQAEIWASCLIGGHDANCAYNESFSLALTGHLDKNALMNALLDVMQLHQALSSTFSADGQNSFISKELLLDVDYKDISTQAKEAQEYFINNFNKQVAVTSFDLVTGPLFKTSLFKLADTEYLLTFVAHHIICDGWSIGIIMQDLSTLYTAYAQNKQVPKIDALRFSDYAKEQLTFEQTKAYQETEKYWLEHFKGSNHLLNLPVDYPRPATHTYKSHRLDLVLDGNLTNEIKKLGKTTGSGFITTMMAAFEIFLKQLTGQDEIILGLPTAGQSATGNFRLVGHCVNLLALRSFPKGDISFNTYLKQRKTEILDAYDHQQYTFGSLLKKLNIPRDTSRVPLVPVMFNIDMGLDNDVNFYGLQYQLISNPREYENFELFLNIAGQNESPTLEWSYNTQLFKTSTIIKMMESFEFLLRELVNNPEMLIGHIPASDSAEIQLQVDSWNNTEYPYPANVALHSLISEQAAKVPLQTAVTFSEHKISYKTLNETANQLAAFLIEKSIKKGDKVALALDRTIEMIVSLMAIMKAGGVYIPLDPQFPIDRINYMLDDSQAIVLLTSQKYKGEYQSKAQELIIEDIWPYLPHYPITNPDIKVNGDDLLYILYTSGSTGMPKGVQIAHYNLVNFLISMQREPGIAASDKLLAVTTISFDIAGLELFLPLISGAEIILADTASSKDGRVLLDIIKKEKVTLMQATPYTWRILLEAGWDSKSPFKVICGGEALPAELANRILNTQSILWNVYGPTETTVWSTAKEITTADKAISIGRPINNTSIYILDEFLRPIAPGIAGEIYIGGDGVAKGYLNRPELTAEKFVNDPFSKIPDSKMYRTGDLGKFMSNGEIECLGRIDSQIKIRGYRIETGEIEFHLSKIKDIKEAVVITLPDQNGIDKLVALVVTCIENSISQSQIQNWKTILKKSLPDYMVPDGFINIQSVPLTSNGKIDKKALAKHALPAADEKSIYLAPRTDIEKLIAEIWIEFLKIERVSVHDNFFELGGHSLIALQVMTRIELKTGKRLPLATLFENPTVEKLTQLLEPGAIPITWNSLVPIKPKGNKMPLYMVHGAGLNVLLFNTLAMHMADDQPVYGLQAKGLDGIEEPLESIEAIAAHYIKEITQQNPTGPYALAGYSFGGIIAYEMARQLEASGKEVKMLAMFDTYAYRSPHFDPPLIKMYKKARFFKDKVLYTFKFENGIKGLNDRARSIKRKIIRAYWDLRYGKDQKHAGFFGYSNKVDKMNEYAGRHYLLKPYNIEVEVFRAEKPTFYMDDFEYLGWKSYALKGVNIHNIPGEHNTIFKAPNDKLFAEVLQKCLDAAINK